jgi:hypothetical protein
MCRTLPLMACSILWGLVSGISSAAAESAHRIAVVSEPHFSEQEAYCDAEDCLRQRLLAQVAGPTAGVLSETIVRHNLTQLLWSRGVRRDQWTETLSKPYGTMYRQHLQLTVPDETLQAWIREVSAACRLRHQLCACAVLATVLGWLGGLWLLVKFDRWTRGDCRLHIIVGTLLMLVFTTSVGWFFILG